MNQEFRHVSDSSWQKGKELYNRFCLTHSDYSREQWESVIRQRVIQSFLLNILNLQEVKFKVNLRCWFECKTSNNNSLM